MASGTGNKPLATLNSAELHKSPLRASSGFRLEAKALKNEFERTSELRRWFAKIHADRRRFYSGVLGLTIFGTVPAPQLCQFVSTLVPASWTHNETVWPAAGSQVRLARLLGGELRLEFA